MLIMILKDIEEYNDYYMDECNENDPSIYLCHGPCPLTYTKIEKQIIYVYIA